MAGRGDFQLFNSEMDFYACEWLTMIFTRRVTVGLGLVVFGLMATIVALSVVLLVASDKKNDRLGIQIQVLSSELGIQSDELRRSLEEHQMLKDHVASSSAYLCNFASQLEDLHNGQSNITEKRYRDFLASMLEHLPPEELGVSDPCYREMERLGLWPLPLKGF